MRTRLFLVVVLFCTGALVWWLSRESIGHTEPGQAANGPGSSGEGSQIIAAAPAVESNSPENAAEPDTSVSGEDPLSTFDKWTAQFLAASAGDRGRLIPEGVALAQQRRGALAELIVRDAREALNRAVPLTVRQELPDEIVALLEEQVNARGFFGVLGIVGGEVPIRRWAQVEDRTYDAYVFGRRERQKTTEQAYLSGIAVDQKMALDERPLRVLEGGERPVRGKPVVKTCPISGLETPVETKEEALPPINEETPAVEVAGTIHYLCSGGHIRAVEENLLAEEAGIAAEGSTGGAAKPTGNVPTSHNTGVRTHLYMRVTFPDQMQDPQNEASCYDMMRQVDEFIRENSFGKCYFITTVTPLLVLPHTESWYKKESADIEILTHARQAAKAAGYDPAQYNFDTVRYSGGPGNFGGQAYVGAKGCWLKSSSVGVAAHEYGHNLGLWHANYWNTSPASVIGPGSNSEYGNSFDTMGAASAGNNHFGAYNKSVINWLTPELVTNVRQSGIYRVFQHDHSVADPANRYGLKIAKDADRNYWLELRQKFTSNTWMMNGLQITWDAWGGGGDSSANGSNGGPQLLDLTPGSPDGKNDSSLVIGRTFSDLETGLHFTPIGKGGTSPESIDVMINLGSFPGNQAPTLAVQASTATAATGVTVNFSANAEDPDGDVLAYAWDFGDRTVSTTNLPTVSKSWSTAGHYVVRCTASDMKGGVVTRQALLTIGSPTGYMISGTVTGPGGQMLEGVHVSNGQTGSNYRGAYSDSNGAYIITNLGAGSHTLTAEKFGYSLTPNFLNPVTVGPHASGRNFSASNASTLSIAAVDPTAREGSTDTATFRIARTGSTSAAKVIRVGNPSGTAKKSTDYTLSPDPVLNSTTGAYELTIPAGAAWLDVTLTTLNDSTQEGQETAILELVPVSGLIISGNVRAVVTIEDDDTSKPSVSITANDEFATEGADSGQFTVTRSAPYAGRLIVRLSFSGSAGNGPDYVTIPSSVAVEDGQPSVTVDVRPIDDTAVEGNESVIATIVNDSQYVKDSVAGSAEVIINDNDLSVVTVAATQSAASESGANGVFTISRTGDLSNALTVHYSLGGTALHGTDYLRLPGVAIIPAGQDSTAVVIVPIDDEIGEPTQTIVLQLRSSPTYQVAAPSSASINLTDNDKPAISVSAVDGIATEPVSGSATDTGRFRIYRAGGTAAFTALYTISGTATPGSDYSTLSGSVSFAAGDTTKDVTISPLPDSLQEGTETVVLTLSPHSTYTVEPESSSTVLLIDEDAVSVSVSTEDTSVSESSTSMRFWISRTGSTSAALRVSYAMTGTALKDVDYSGATGTVTIPAQAEGVYLTLTPINDTLPEGTESVTLEIVPVSGLYVPGIRSATYLLADNDTGGLPTVRFASTAGGGAESVGTVTVPVTLSGPSPNRITVSFGIAGGSATAGGVDYMMTAGVLTFEPGTVSQVISFDVVDDNRPEGSETIVLGLSAPTGAVLGSSSFTYTIIDNDPGPGVSVGFAASSSSVQETTSAPQTLLVALSESSVTPVTVSYAVAGGSASPGADFQLSAGTLSFAPGETAKHIPITIFPDALSEGNETVVVSLSNPSGAVLRTPSQHTLTIEGQAVIVSLQVPDGSASEPSESGTFRLVRTGANIGPLDVTISVGGTASNGVDYHPIPNIIHFAPGQVSANVQISPLDDRVIEGTETVIVAVVSSAGYTAGDDPAVLVIQDDDRNAAPRFTMGGDVNVLEDSESRAVAGWATEINPGVGESGQTVTFIVSNDNPSLFSDAPVVSSSGTLAFRPAPDAFGSATVTVQARDDGGTANGGSDTSAARTFTITVLPVNDAPRFTGGGSQTVNEDAGLQTVAWASGISVGPAEEATQSLEFIIETDRPELFAVLPSISPTGILTYTPAPDLNGTASVSVEARDSGGTSNGGVDTSGEHQFAILIREVNDAPSFTKGPNQHLKQNGGTQEVPEWATAIRSGPANEAGQQLTFIVSVDRPELFTSTPSITPDGTLRFTPSWEANGTATVTVRLSDTGGTENGGVDVSPPETFVISSAGVNDPPSFVPGPDQSVAQDAGPQTVTGWATGISPGPADETDQTVEFLVTVDEPALFAVLPSIAPDGTLTYTPAADGSGKAVVTVLLRDNGGTMDDGVDTSAAITFTIAVTTFAEEAGSYHGLVQAASGESLAIDRFGTVTVAVQRKGKFTGQLKLAGQKFPFKGAFDKAGIAQFGKQLTPELAIKRRNLPELLLSLQLDVSEGTDKVTGRIEVGESLVATVEADRALYTDKRNPVSPYRNVPAELLGRYNLLFRARTPEEQGMPGTTFPQGYGIGVLKVNKRGIARLVGTLAEGSPISCSAPLSKQNDWPLHSAFNKRKDSITVPVHLSGTPGLAHLDGSDAVWIKAPSPKARRYSAGWATGIRVDLIGERYQDRSGESALGSLEPEDLDGNAVLLLGAETSIEPLNVALNIDPNGKIKPINPPFSLQLKLKESTGVLSGSLRDSMMKKAVKLKGLALPEQQIVGGYFLGPTQSSPIKLTPSEATAPETVAAE